MSLQTLRTWKIEIAVRNIPGITCTLVMIQRRNSNLWIVLAM